MIPAPLDNPVFGHIRETVDRLGVEAYVVGGFVRDYYLRRPSTDIDVVVVGDGVAVAEDLGRKLRAKVSIFKTFGTAMLRWQGTEVEFVGARRESYSHDSRKPQVEPGTLEDASAAATSRSTLWRGRSTPRHSAGWSTPSTACTISKSAPYAPRAIPT